MKVILSMIIRRPETNPPQIITDIITKEYDSADVIPRKGDIIQEMLWYEDDTVHFEVQKTIINFKDNVCYVDLPDKVVDTLDEQRKLAEEAKSNGWKQILHTQSRKTLEIQRLFYFD